MDLVEGWKKKPPSRYIIIVLKYMKHHIRYIRYVTFMFIYIVHIQQSNVVLLHFQFLEALAMPHPSQLLPIGSEHWVGASTPPPMVKSCYSWYPPRRYERVGVGDGQSVQSCALKVFEKLGEINIQHFRSVIALSLHPLPSLN